jgi:hypothetical protein
VHFFIRFKKKKDLDELFRFFKDTEEIKLKLIDMALTCGKNIKYIESIKKMKSNILNSLTNGEEMKTFYKEELLRINGGKVDE